VNSQAAIVSRHSEHFLESCLPASLPGFAAGNERFFCAPTRWLAAQAQCKNPWTGRGSDFSDDGDLINLNELPGVVMASRFTNERM
jgi:hypothetical protein